MSVLTVNYVDDTNDAPFLSYPKAMIVLTNNNKLYAAPRYDSSTQGINLLWSLDNRLKGNVINDILRAIKPFVSEILILENYDEHARFLIYHDVRSIINKFENDRNNIVRQIHYYDYVDGTELPPAFRDSIDSGDFVDEYGIVFYESSDEIYDKLTAELVEDILDNSDSYESASKIIKSVYSDYKKDGYSDEFWNDLIPMVINESGYDDTYSVSSGNLYYNNQLIKL